MTLTGAAPEMTAVWQNSKLRGETQKGLQLCGQWPTVWVTSYRSLRGLECVLKKMHSCATHRHRIGRRGVQKTSAWPLAFCVLTAILDPSLKLQEFQQGQPTLHASFPTLNFCKHSGFRDAAAEPVPHILRLSEPRRSKLGMAYRVGEGSTGRMKSRL
jgi:hypothetical protein